MDFCCEKKTEPIFPYYIHSWFHLSIAIIQLPLRLGVRHSAQSTHTNAFALTCLHISTLCYSYSITNSNRADIQYFLSLISMAAHSHTSLQTGMQTNTLILHTNGYDNGKHAYAIVLCSLLSDCVCVCVEGISLWMYTSVCVRACMCYSK